ncbi:hypothetical protein [Bradyrhizobium canariense]|uniref:hypothetical protein n=1 Tax=Bradyrhizobium canariense TaxID=255045 RepID=UPI0034DE9E65
MREARTWCPGELDELLAKPFWNITKLEYSLHAALAEHWEHGETSWRRVRSAGRLIVLARKQLMRSGRGMRDDIPKRAP